MAQPIQTLFKDAVVKSIPLKGSGTYDSEPNLVSGMPGRSGGYLPEKTREQIAPAPANREPGKDMWLLKK